MTTFADDPTTRPAMVPLPYGWAAPSTACVCGHARHRHETIDMGHSTRAVECLDCVCAAPEYPNISGTPLDSAVTAFVERYGTRILTEPENSRGACKDASGVFVEVLAEHGLDGRLVFGVSTTAEGDAIHGHWAVSLDGDVWDWTPRQFWPHDQTVPLVRTVAEWRSVWKPDRSG